ncbi:MAG: PaaI family thioesterase [Pseudomonadota bacterium]
MDLKASGKTISLNGFPHAEEIGMEMTPTGDGEVLVTVPYAEKLVGDAETGVVHGGVITTILDTGCGIAAIAKTGKMGGIATLDLRIDYMRPAKPGETLKAACECYRVTRSVAFARGVAYDADPDDPVATAAGAFMLTGGDE